MSKPDDFDNVDPAPPAPLDLSKWSKLPGLLLGIGALITVIGAIWSFNRDGGREFGYTWLVSFMFYLSIGLGALFLVLAHHLFDAGWSVPTRRFCEHISTLLFPTMAVLFLPIAFLAPKMFHWMKMETHPDHALAAKFPLFTTSGFYISTAACFALWWLLTNRLKYWSLKQDETGEARCTYRMRMHASWGIWVFAITLTTGAIMWMKGLEHEWFSTMYGVCYFAGSVWLTLATVYVITMILDRQRVLTDVLHEHQFYFLGTLMFAFTVFYAYVNFSQYFIIWNANIPEETFWFVQREQGTWFSVSMIIIFGHFFLPFLALLRIDVKHTFTLMVPICLWSWAMHYVDMTFQILPVAHPDGFPFFTLWLQFGCMAFMGGLLTKIFLRKFAGTPPFPLKDPRLVEAMGLYHPVPTQISGGEVEDVDTMPGGEVQHGGNH